VLGGPPLLGLAACDPSDPLLIIVLDATGFTDTPVLLSVIVGAFAFTCIRHSVRSQRTPHTVPSASWSSADAPSDLLYWAPQASQAFLCCSQCGVAVCIRAHVKI